MQTEGTTTMIKMLLLGIFTLAHFPGFTDQQNQWANSLHNKRGNNCCTSADGAPVKDADWGIEGGHYWVFVHGQRLSVPDDSVIVAPNPTGAALVWPRQERGGALGVMCFLPGKLS